MKKPLKKLSLNPETIRRLNNQILAELQGGVTAVLASHITMGCTSCGPTCGACTTGLEC